MTRTFLNRFLFHWGPGRGKSGVVALLLLTIPLHLVAQARPMPAANAGDSVAVRFIDADLRVVLQALGRYLSKPLLMSGVPQERITLDYAAALPRSQLVEIIRGLIEPRGLELKEEASYFTVIPRPAPVLAPPNSGSTGSQVAVQLFVIRLKHAKAPDVAATINLLFGGSGEFSGAGGLSTGTLSDELRRNLVSPNLAAHPVQPGAPNANLRPASLAGPVTLVPDERTNSLLVRAGPEDFEVLKAAVAELDVRPLQVLIEVLIVEARKDRSFSLGAGFSAERSDASGNQKATLVGPGAADLVLQFLHLGRTQVSAILATAQAKGDVEIISRPVILASNNTEATILVGSQRPFVQVSRSLPTDTPTRDQVIQYKDVGTKLTVRPTINEDGYVSLLIQQEISAATSESQFDAPIISTREVRTEVLVRDSQTIVLGGLSDQTKERSSSGIPVLSGIPIIGGLFGSSRRRSNGTELFLFLTPRIIRTDADADSLTARRRPPR